MTPAPVQLDFLLAFFGPLLKLPDAAELLACSQDHVANMVDDGSLRAVNIAAGDRTRREIRIYRYTVDFWTYRRAGHPAAARKPSAVDPAHILPHARPHLLKREVAKVLDCTEAHVANLAAAGHLAGPSLNLGSLARLPRYEADSLLRFVSIREIL